MPIGKEGKKTNALDAHMWFIKYASDHGFNTGERLLWYAIAYELIDNGQPVDENGNVQISTNELMNLTSLPKTSLWRARNDLTERGLLKVENGDTRRMPTYTLIGSTLELYGSTLKRYGSTVKLTNVPQNPAIAGIARDCGVVRDFPNISQIGEEEEDIYNIYISNNNTNTNNIDNIYINHNNIDDNSLAGRLCAFWLQQTGRRIAMETAQRLVTQAKVAKMDFDVLLLLLERSESANVPMQYAFTLLLDWKKNGIHTKADAENYLTRRKERKDKYVQPPKRLKEQEYNQRTYTPSDAALDAMMEAWRQESEVARNGE